MTLASFILASASPRRKDLLTELGVRFEVRPCELPEPAAKPAHVRPTSWAEALAYFKAAAVAQQVEGAWVLGADTIVACDGEILGKPADVADARRMLELQAGRRSDVITGVAFVCSGMPEQRVIAHDVTGVWMADRPAEREDYLVSGDWAGKAGAYGIQTIGDRLVERIEGSFTNVVGLPTELVERILEQLGRSPAGHRKSLSTRT